MRQQKGKVQIELDKANAEIARLRRQSKRNNKLHFDSIRTSNPSLEEESCRYKVSKKSTAKVVNDNKENENKSSNKGYPIRTSKVSNYKADWFSKNGERESGKPSIFH